MCHIATTAPEQATGEVARLYRRQQGALDYVPNYARLFCHRPQLMGHIADTMHALKDTMPTRLWLLVNLAAARAAGSDYCSLAFAHKLLAHGMDPEGLCAVLRDEEDAVAPGERAAMVFAGRVARDAGAVDAAAVESLRAQGYSEQQIFDVAAAAAWRCFFASLPAALGARPDPALRRLDPQVHALIISHTQEDPK